VPRRTALLAMATSATFAAACLAAARIERAGR
jgi:hypothetical protein